MTTAITTSSVAFCVPLLIVLGCALLLVLEDRREAHPRPISDHFGKGLDTKRKLAIWFGK